MASLGLCFHLLPNWVCAYSEGSYKTTPAVDIYAIGTNVMGWLGHILIVSWIGLFWFKGVLNHRHSFGVIENSNTRQAHSQALSFTLVNVKAPVVATTNWWWLISALVLAKKVKNLYLFTVWFIYKPAIILFVMTLGTQTIGTFQFMALPSNWWLSSWFGLQIQHSSGVLPWNGLFSNVTI